MINKYLLMIISTLVVLFLWSLYAFSKVECTCPWNEKGFLVSTIISGLVLMINIGIIHLLVQKRSKRIYLYYTITLIISAIIFVIIMRSLVSLMTNFIIG